MPRLGLFLCACALQELPESGDYQEGTDEGTGGGGRCWTLSGKEKYTLGCLLRSEPFLCEVDTMRLENHRINLDVFHKTERFITRPRSVSV